jgi:hypothetical protein
MAERVGFEPTDRGSPDQRFSRPSHSTALAPLRLRLFGGEGGIRTHGRVSPTHAFQACSLSHSDTSPNFLKRTSPLAPKPGEETTEQLPAFLRQHAVDDFEAMVQANVLNQIA